MRLEDIKSVYFLGAGGIGMSALVRYFISEGKFVAGYDRTPSPLTEKLMEEGAVLHFEENVELIPEECKNPENTLVIYTPAIPDDHKEWGIFRNGNFNIKKRAEVLGIITRGKSGVCVAGTANNIRRHNLAVARLLRQPDSLPIAWSQIIFGISQHIVISEISHLNLIVDLSIAIQRTINIQTCSIVEI